ncbi:MAG: G5 domain-containing protein [Armatimonadetes bacterium]|nr:G5 domain-containing protein [Armatimonadota bacterium]
MPPKRHSAPRRLHATYLLLILVSGLLAGIGLVFLIHAARGDVAVQTAATPEERSSGPASFAGQVAAPASTVPAVMSLAVRLSASSVLSQLKVVALAADGQTRQVLATGASVADVLAEHRVPRGSLDRVTPSPETTAWSGMQVRVVRVREAEVVEQVPVAPGEIRHTDPQLPSGTVVVKAEGQPGLKERRVRRVYADSRLESTRVMGEKVLRAAQPRLIGVGTRMQVASRGEFTGRPTLLMEATAYYPGPLNYGGGVNHITAIGTRARRGVVAVDPRVIPLKSRLFIEGYGFAVAEDTGGSIKGQRIDLCFDTYREAIKFGRRQVRVYILERPGDPPYRPQEKDKVDPR